MLDQASGAEFQGVTEEDLAKVLAAPSVSWRRWRGSRRFANQWLTAPATTTPSQAAAAGATMFVYSEIMGCRICLPSHRGKILSFAAPAPHRKGGTTLAAQRENLFRLLPATLEMRDIMDGVGSLFTKHYAFPTDGFTASRGPVCCPQRMLQA